MLTRISGRGEGQKNRLKGIGVSSCNLDVGFEPARWVFTVFSTPATPKKSLSAFPTPDSQASANHYFLHQHAGVGVCHRKNQTRIAAAPA